MHMVDVLPTVLSAAGVESFIPLGLDGVNQWKAINSLKTLAAPRTGIVYNIDDSLVPGQLDGPARRTMFQVALREGNYKMIWGQATMLHRGFRSAKKNGVEVNEEQGLELYNLFDDPGEERNLADPATANASSANIVEQLKEIAIGYHRGLAPPRLGLLTTQEVLDEDSEFGGVTSWCRALLAVNCFPHQGGDGLTKPTTPNAAIEVLFSSLPDPRVPKASLCVSYLQTTNATEVSKSGD